MNRFRCSSGLRPRLMAAFVVTLLVPGLASAESIQFHNETPIPVVIQLAGVVRGVLLRDRPYLLSPTDKSPAVNLGGNKVVTIYEAKVPNRVLFQGVIPAGAEDQVLSIRLDGTRLKLEKEKPKRSDKP